MSLPSEIDAAIDQMRARYRATKGTPSIRQEIERELAAQFPDYVFKVAQHGDDLAAAKEAILAACVRYNQVGKMSGLTVSEVRFSRSDGLTEAIDVSKSNEILFDKDDSPALLPDLAYEPFVIQPDLMGIIFDARGCPRDVRGQSLNRR